MAKKNFDAFINSAGKKPKLTPEEVEAMAKQLHQPAAAQPLRALPAQEKVVKTAATTIAKPKPAAPKAEAMPGPAAKLARNTGLAEPPKEKVRITIDLAKELYKRMKLAVVQNETEISSYVRTLIEKDLNRK